MIKHWLCVARNKDTPDPAFRQALAEIGRLLMYECTRDWLDTVDFKVESPMGVADATVVDPTKPICLVPILRAGLVLLESCGTSLPASRTYHLGFVRDEETLEATMYLNKLPERFEKGSKVLLTDPMIATGGTLAKAIDLCVERGADPDDIRVLAVVAAPPALQMLSEKYTGLRIYAAMIDPELNDVGYIVPGLGDAGDRCFGTD